MKNVTSLLNGEFDNYHNFYDWFCSENSLEKRAKSFIPKIKFLVKEKIINPDKVYIWFKNNYPMDGNLYDDMRISEVDSNNFLGGICPSSGHNSKKGQCEIWGLEKFNFKYNSTFTFQDTFNSWSDLKKEIKNNPEFKEKLQKQFFKV